jgi:hypothetical protein
MSEHLEPLVLDFVEWIARRPRSYAEAMDAWRTSCPKLTVWEEATERGLVLRQSMQGGAAIVVATPRGRRLLRQHGRLPNAAMQASPSRRERRSLTVARS